MTQIDGMGGRDVRLSMFRALGKVRPASIPFCDRGKQGSPRPLTANGLLQASLCHA